MSLIYLTGSTGFVGKSILRYFGIKNIILHKKGEEYKLFANSNVINLVGKAHDLKNCTDINEYYQVNTELTKKLYQIFLVSNAKVFITLSSVKAIADVVDCELSEDTPANPITHYGKSKLLAEQYILSQKIPKGKRVFILRPCMIHGPGNKGNLNLLYKLVSLGIPWPLGVFENSRSYLSIENLCFIIKELIYNENIPSGVYNVADDTPLSTNEVIKLIAESKYKKAMILNLNKNLIMLLVRIGDFFKLPFNSERLQKLTENYVVSNAKIKAAIAKPLPISSKLGLLRTFQSFSSNA